MTFVLVHGAADQAASWDEVAAALRGRGHQVVAVDLPCEDDAAGFEQYADTVVEAIGADHDDLVVVGHSLGGYTATLVADRVPARPAGLRDRHGAAPGRERRRVVGQHRPRLRHRRRDRDLPERRHARAGRAGAGAGPRPVGHTDGASPSRWRRCRTCPRATWCARATTSSLRTGRARWRATGWASSRRDRGRALPVHHPAGGAGAAPADRNRCAWTLVHDLLAPGPRALDGGPAAARCCTASRRWRTWTPTRSASAWPPPTATSTSRATPTCRSASSRSRRRSPTGWRSWTTAPSRWTRRSTWSRRASCSTRSACTRSRTGRATR